MLRECQNQPAVKISAGEVARMFEKQFQYKNNNSDAAAGKWTLPRGQLFSEFYQFTELQQAKQTLNEVKSKLNDYSIEEWSAHTQRKDPAGEVPWFIKNELKAEFVTVAWCKFFECLHRFPLVSGPRLNTLHLCEAPGAFIAALNHYMHSTYPKEEISWHWFATSLNPYYEGNQLGRMIVDDRVMLATLEHWLFHDDFTGDIMRSRNIRDMRQRCLQQVPQIDLITADGSIDCMATPADQEEVVATLHFAEILAALSILAEGGCFVLKKFTLFEAASVSVMYLLNCVFAEVHTYKPCTSRRGNSEVYVLCCGYRPQTENLPAILRHMETQLDEGNCVMPLFAKAHLPADFVQQHVACCRLFMDCQIEAIESNLLSFAYKSDRFQTRRSHALRSLVRKEYVQRYQVEELPADCRVIRNGPQGLAKTAAKCFFYKGSYAERQLLKSHDVPAQVFVLQRRLNEMEKSLSSSLSRTLQVEREQGKGLLGVQRGQAYASLNSSLFAAAPCMLFCQEIFATIAMHPLHGLRASCTIKGGKDEIISVKSTEKENSGGKDEIEFLYDSRESFYQQQKDFFCRILAALLGQPHIEQLVFRNFPFLSHFSVSILMYLQLVAFHELRLTTEQGFLVSAKASRTLTAEQLGLFKELQDLLSAASGKDEAAVLSVLPIPRLHRTELNHSLVAYNNLLLLGRCRDLLHQLHQ